MEISREERMFLSQSSACSSCEDNILTLKVVAAKPWKSLDYGMFLQSHVAPLAIVGNVCTAARFQSSNEMMSASMPAEQDWGYENREQCSSVGIPTTGILPWPHTKIVGVVLTFPTKWPGIFINCGSNSRRRRGKQLLKRLQDKERSNTTSIKEEEKLEEANSHFAAERLPDHPMQTKRRTVFQCPDHLIVHVKPVSQLHLRASYFLSNLRLFRGRKLRLSAVFWWTEDGVINVGTRVKCLRRLVCLHLDIAAGNVVQNLKEANLLFDTSRLDVGDLLQNSLVTKMVRMYQFT
ncbi:hypothetical protein CCUS01_07304 [Colletotrichum cuscutae]|uniref:Uncharacterized protein n=1 Tax=Colletotrichum cuscutae TaxID=1209917 RepID=A0AAI9UX88_9PEZI|nr:hypothetical protein CCUS01_07304 [Colletotrichum cuscutae]